ncbi:MAG: 3'-5' exonuclease [Flavobacteriales bacterium]|nr:3'-5' exonuclease [Flavobacteriales bacterium]
MSEEFSYLDKLNDVQRQAVECTEGPMMIIAGAGSGKTRVLTYRIAHLINKGVSPFNILALTFTNKAAREMQERISTIVGASDAKSLWMGTFHSVFAKILRSEAPKLGFPSNFTIYDTDDAQRLVTQIIKDLALDKEIYKPRQVLSRISSLKNNLITTSVYERYPECTEADSAARRPKLIDIYRQYVERCFKAGAMDFDDLLLRTNELLARFPDVLSKYQNMFRYILVDEYQDTNHSQYLIVRALADRFQNICVVGDDSQSIYSFRGANIANILHFNRDYPSAKVFKLEQNYRSTKNIVGAANSVIKRNKEKLDKNVWTSNTDGEKITVVCNPTDNEEAYYIARSIKKFKETEPDDNYEDFAILYRTNAQSRALEDALRRHNIPYKIWGGNSFYSKKEIKDFLAYMRLCINPKDEEALLRIINYPIRGIGNTTIDKLIVTAHHYDRTIFEVIKNLDKLPQLSINSGTRATLDAFSSMIEAFGVYAATDDAFTAGEKILKESGMLKKLASATEPEEIARYENVQEMLNSMKDFVETQKEIADSDSTLASFIQDVSLMTDVDRSDQDKKDSVALMTVHMAKGLEFKTVYIAGMEEELFPSMMSSAERSDVEEERRLFYVALTRAEKRAILTYARQRCRYGKTSDCELSRFVQEIDDQYLDMSVPADMAKSVSNILDASIFGSSDKIVARGASAQNYGQTYRRGGDETSYQRKESAKPTFDTGNFKPVSASSSSQAKAGEINLNVGQRVRHERFGDGTVTAVEGSGIDSKAIIDFDNIGIKKMLLKFAKIQKI